VAVHKFRFYGIYRYQNATTADAAKVDHGTQVPCRTGTMPSCNQPPALFGRVGAYKCMIEECDVSAYPGLRGTTAMQLFSRYLYDKLLTVFRRLWNFGMTYLG